MAVDDHGGGVDDEADVDAGVVEVDPGRVVEGRDHRDWFAPAVLLPQVRQGHPLVRVLGLRPPVHGVFRHVAQEPTGHS